ncbi:MAG: ATP-binding protein, partial [Candidatus Omnitrophica bacterium]|nr:ATP-binding protein [Candidatus Omnitrophota bacterium]
MLFKKIKYSVVFKAIALFLLHAFLVSSVSFAMNASDFVLAPPDNFNTIARVFNGIRVEYDIGSKISPKTKDDFRKRAEGTDDITNSLRKLPLFKISGRFRSLEMIYRGCLYNSFDAIVDKLSKGDTRDFKGKIVGELYFDGDELVISVIDNGETIDFEENGTPVRRARNRQNQFGGQGKNNRQGTQIAKEVTRKLGGSIRWHPLKGGTWTVLKIPISNIPEKIELGKKERIVVEDKTARIDWNKETRKTALSMKEVRVKGKKKLIHRYNTYKPFINRTAFMYICEKLDKYLTLGISEHTTRKDLRDDVKLASRAIEEIRKTVPQGELEQSKTRLDPMLYGFELDELYYRDNAFYLPIYRDDEQGNRIKTYEYKFYKDGDGKTAWVIVQPEQELIIPQELTVKREETLAQLRSIKPNTILTDEQKHLVRLLIDFFGTDYLTPSVEKAEPDDPPSLQYLIPLVERFQNSRYFSPLSSEEDARYREIAAALTAPNIGHMLRRYGIFYPTIYAIARRTNHPVQKLLDDYKTTIFLLQSITGIMPGRAHLADGRKARYVVTLLTEALEKTTTCSAEISQILSKDTTLHGMLNEKTVEDIKRYSIEAADFYAKLVSWQKNGLDEETRHATLGALMVEIEKRVYRLKYEGINIKL